MDLLSPEIIREARSAYYGLITQCDYNMGRVFAALQDLELFRETLILYCSDHGELLGDHHSGSKAFFHEGASHVPFALRLPASWERHCGARVSTPVTHADIMPTLAAAAGGEAPPGCDGQNLLALLQGEAPTRHYLEAAHPAGACCALTDGRWKYFLSRRRPGATLRPRIRPARTHRSRAPASTRRKTTRTARGTHAAPHRTRLGRRGRWATHRKTATRRQHGLAARALLAWLSHRTFRRGRAPLK